MPSIEQQANRWVVREKDGALDDAGRAELAAWCGADVRHQGAYLRALAIHAALLDAAAAEAGAIPVQVPRRRAALKMGALAASLAVAAGTGVLLTRPRTDTYATTAGEFRTVPLADQSMAHIDSGSSIAVTVTGSLRRVELRQGQAWFDVAKDRARPFVVEAGLARARAVGTSFAVARHAGGADVLVTEGVVEVWREDGTAMRKLVLAAGDRARVEDAGPVTVERRSRDIARLLAWREGRIVFDNEALADAVARFNRYGRPPIVLADPALGRRRVVGRYAVDDPESFARDVAAWLGVPVSITHERIIVGDVRLLDGGARSRNNRAIDKN